MEYDQVFIMDDFINEQQIIDAKEAIKAQEINPEAVAEEINLLYVAATRTKSKLHLPIHLLPTSYQIHDFNTVSNILNLSLKPKTVKTKPQRSNQLWSKMEEAELKQLFIQGKTVKEIAILLGRSQSAVIRRVEKLDLWF